MRSSANLKLEQKEEKASAVTLFDQIYEIAKHAETDADAEKKIADILAENVCINVRDHSGMHTPVSRLAKEGNKKAVELLIKLGANVNYAAWGAAQNDDHALAEYLHVHHSAHVNYLGSGAAFARKRKYAEYWRIHHGSNVNDIAKNAAQARDRAYAEYLRIHHGANATVIAEGAARAGDREYAEWLRVYHGAEPSAISRGAARGLHFDYAKELYQYNKAKVSEVAWGAGFVDDREHVKELCDEYPAAMEHAALGALMGGHRAAAENARLNHHASVDLLAETAAKQNDLVHAERLRTEHHADVNYLAWGAASSCLRLYAERLRVMAGVRLYEMTRGAIFGGHYDYIEDLCVKHGAQIKDFVKKAVESEDFANKKIALHMLSFMKDKNYRKKLAASMHKQKVLPYDITKLVLKAEKIAELRPRYNYDQCIALGNREIQTWFLQCTILLDKKRIGMGLFLTIATYLSPLAPQEAKDLYEKSRLDISKRWLKQGEKRYAKKDKNTQEFFKSCARTETREQLVTLFNNESGRIKEDKAYQGSKKPHSYSDFLTRKFKMI